jgi:TldD protein
MRSHVPVGSFFPDGIDAETLRALALSGIDAARQLGADYADIRVADWRTFVVDWGDSDTPGGGMSFDAGYGLRVRVGGTWSFAFGGNPTTDAVVQSARGAVATAKCVSRFGPRAHALAPAPVVRGEWETPIEIDPFAVSPDDHGIAVRALREAARRVPLGQVDGGNPFWWNAETRVFASTEGALITQRLRRANPRVWIAARSPSKPIFRLPVTQLFPQSAGFEIVTGAPLQEQVKETAEDAVRLASYPMRQAEVGRVGGVLDGISAANMLGQTLGAALELERALGYQADSIGTSWLAPVESILGQQLFSPAVTVTTDRAMPTFGAARWDDEGVQTESIPVIDRGRVVDYFTTRDSAPMLEHWYSSQQKPTVSRGSAIAWSATTSPSGCAAQLSLAPGKAGVTLDTMLKQLDSGVVIRGQRTISVDQQLRGGVMYMPSLFDVKRGQITSRLENAMVQFTTKRWWSAVNVVGDATTRQYGVRMQSRGEFGVLATLPVIAPAIGVSEIEVMPLPRFT